ncbi:MAG: hypothetical protein AAB738_02995 [Patescibacteria group bacterium]
MTWLNVYILCVLVLVLAAQFFYRFSSWRLENFLSKPLHQSVKDFKLEGKRSVWERFCGGATALGMWCGGRFKFKILLRWVWILSVAVIFGTFLYWSNLQYDLWKNGGGFLKFMLPPYQSISYFLSYVGVRFFGPWILAFLMSLLVSRAAKYLNRCFGERFFENEEIELIALGVFLTGYPGFFIYLGLILVLGVLFSLVYQILAKGRLPLYYFWMSMAVFAIIIKDWLIPALGWQMLLAGFSLGDFYKLFFGS